MSAPVKPVVIPAMASRSMSGARRTLRTCTLRISSRPLRSGRSTSTWRSNRPARNSAGSENFRPIGGGQQDDAGARIEAVEFGEELIEGLLLLVGAAETAGDAATSQRVEFVDENDAGRGLARLLEQIAHARGADADEHLDEFGAGNGKERHAGLAGDRLGQQRLAGSRRADQQNPLRHPRPQPAIGFRIAQEGDQLLQLELRLLDAGDILESHLGIRLHINLGARFADRHQPAQPLLLGKAAKQKHPSDVKDDNGNDPREDGLHDAAGAPCR